jgi:hypothetical protein
VTTGYEAGFYRDVTSISRDLKETNRILERIATALEQRFAPGNVDELYAEDGAKPPTELFP